MPGIAVTWLNLGLFPTQSTGVVSVRYLANISFRQQQSLTLQLAVTSPLKYKVENIGFPILILHVHKLNFNTFAEVHKIYDISSRYLCDTDTLDLNVSLQFIVTRQSRAEDVDRELHCSSLNCSNLRHQTITRTAHTRNAVSPMTQPSTLCGTAE